MEKHIDLVSHRVYLVNYKLKFHFQTAIGCSRRDRKKRFAYPSVTSMNVKKKPWLIVYAKRWQRCQTLFSLRGQFMYSNKCGGSHVSKKQFNLILKLEKKRKDMVAFNPLYYYCNRTVMKLQSVRYNRMRLKSHFVQMFYSRNKLLLSTSYKSFTL